MGPSLVQIVLGLISAFLYNHSGTETINLGSTGNLNEAQMVKIGGETYALDVTTSGNRAVALNWADASQYCKDKYGKTGRLANVDQHDTFLMLQEALGKRYPGTYLKIWVDGLCNGSQFIWRERGIPVDQPWTQWGKGEPTKPFTLSRRVVWHQVTDTRAEFHTDDATSLHGYLCQHRTGAQ